MKLRQIGKDLLLALNLDLTEFIFMIELQAVTLDWKNTGKSDTKPQFSFSDLLFFIFNYLLNNKPKKEVKSKTLSAD